LSEDTDQKFGLAGNEQAQGYEPMPVAHPVASSPDDISTDSTMTESELAHFKRPEPEPPVDRSYRDGSGNEMDDKYSVDQNQAASDLTRVRAEEGAAREQRDADDLRFALDQLPQDGQQPQQPAEDLSQQPAALDEPQPETMDPEAAQAHHDAAWEEADVAIAKAFENPYIRSKIESEFDAVRAESKQEVEKAHNLSAAVRDHYVTATNNLVAEANGLLGVLYPELNGLNPDQMQGALRVMQQQNPQRVQALQQLASRAAGLVEAQARQQHEAAQGQAMQRDHELQQFTAAEEKRFEEATKYESPETMLKIRSQLYDVTEKHYGINKQTMQRIYSGEQRVDSAAFVRSSAFQLMLKDAVAYRLSKQGITQARANPVQKVMRPGVSESGPSDNSEYASLERSLRGKDLTAKQGAELLLAHRGRR
jgi:hypothetical protein